MLSIKTGDYRRYKFQRKALCETFATCIAHNSCQFDCNVCNQFRNSQLFAVITIFEIEKFLRDFVFGSTSSLNCFAFYI